MKYSKIVELSKALSEINLPGVTFAYAVTKNKNILKPEIVALQEAEKPSDDYIQYDKKRVEIVKKYAKKDEKGKFIIVNNQYEIENLEEFEKEFEDLQEKHSEVLEKRADQLKEVDNLLDKEVDITLHKVNIKDIPQSITTKQLESIFDIIEE